MVIFQSKTPLAYYFLIGFLTLTIIVFTSFAIIERLDILSSIFCVVTLNLFAFYLFGRYMCILTLMKDKIILTSLYLNKKQEFKFNGISELDFRGDTVRSALGMLVPGTNYSFQRGFYRLYLTDKKGILLDIKYNISEADNEKVLKMLEQIAK